ncbi:hypothetical protein MGALJ_61660 (plasmid) [Mycobacterium gallinarum]|uniref:Uncharacterized protein n=1 Tax=Mycobacterium gallinarum TaxID=39689 RepID=A0A9W4BLU9_9MYCO|nr:hypothetical protein MGALJ_61660 [Mycobacterium gallinarum]
MPSSHATTNLLAVPIAETVFEPRVGGHIYDVGIDRSLCKWARVLAYEPPSRVVSSWDIGPTWQLETDPAKTSEVEVRFIGRVRRSDSGGVGASPCRSPRPRLASRRRRSRARLLGEGSHRSLAVWTVGPFGV